MRPPQIVQLLTASGGGRELKLRRCVSRDMRRPGSSTVKVEGGKERTHPSQDLHAAEGKAKLLSESAALGFRNVQVRGSCSCFLLSSGGLERMKTELREEVSGHSSVSDMESDSDSPTEVKMRATNTQEDGAALGGDRCSNVAPLQDKASSSSSEEDSDSSQEVERVSSQREGSGHTIELDQCGHKLRHKQKPLKR